MNEKTETQTKLQPLIDLGLGSEQMANLVQAMRDNAADMFSIDLQFGKAIAALAPLLDIVNNRTIDLITPDPEATPNAEL